MEILKKQTFNASELADIREVSVDPNLGRGERIDEETPTISAAAISWSMPTMPRTAHR